MSAKHMSKARLFGTLSAVLAAFMPITAQAQTPAQGNAEAQRAQLRSLMELYVLASFARGADYVCAILPEGELRAVNVLEQRLGDQIRKVGGQKAIDGIDQFNRGAAEAKDCALSKDAAEFLGNARTMARALVAAPMLMQSDPGECYVVGALDKVPREDWQVLKDVPSAKENDPARQVMFDNLRAGFAGFIDQDCAGMVHQSDLLQPGYGALRRLEDNARIGADYTVPTLTRKIGVGVVLNPASRYLGRWQSQAGGFNGSALRVGLDFYRVDATGDVATGFITLENKAMFGAQGKMLFTRKGRWIAKIRGSVEAIELRFDDGTTMPMAKTEESGEGVHRFTTFVLPDADQRKIDRMDDETTASFAYREKGGAWEHFLKLGKNAPKQELNLQYLRASLVWANAPRPEEKK